MFEGRVWLVGGLAVAFALAPAVAFALAPAVAFVAFPAVAFAVAFAAAFAVAFVAFAVGASTFWRTICACAGWLGASGTSNK